MSIFEIEISLPEQVSYIKMPWKWYTQTCARYISNEWNLLVKVIDQKTSWFKDAIRNLACMWERRKKGILEMSEISLRGCFLIAIQSTFRWCPDHHFPYYRNSAIVQHQADVPGGVPLIHLVGKVDLICLGLSNFKRCFLEINKQSFSYI